MIVFFVTRVHRDPRHEVGGGGRGLGAGRVRRALAAALRPGLRLALRHAAASARAPPCQALPVTPGNATTYIQKF